MPEWHLCVMPDLALSKAAQDETEASVATYCGRKQFRRNGAAAVNCQLNDFLSALRHGN